MILLKKAVRSIWRHKRSYIACVALMAVGIMVYTSFNMLFINLDFAKEKMYGDQRFADVFAQVRGIPLNEVSALVDIPGVARAQGTITAEARAMVSGKEDRVITLRVLSYDPASAEPLNDFLVTNGAAPSENEVLLGQAFATANGLKAGDTLPLVIAGKEVTMTVSGTAQSPEYVYAIPDEGQLMPDNETFGFGYVTYGQLATVTGNEGLCDSLAFSLAEGFAFDDVRFGLEDALAPYGLISLIPRKDQPSNNMLSQEITSMGSMATSMPMVFILMAVIILYIMLKRVIEQERGSIGTLKAFGFTDLEVQTHYLCYGFITGAAGGVFGCVFGVLLSGVFTGIYLEYFNLPALTATADPKFLLYGMLIAIISGGVGAFMGTRGVLKLNPAEAMRPPTPRIVKTDVLSYLPFLKYTLATNGSMAIRNISRSVFRSLFVVLGIALSFAIIGFTHSYTDMFDKLLLEQFSKVQLYDVKVSLKEPQSYTGGVEAVYGVGGITAAEGLLEVPAEIRLQNHKKSVAITCMESGAKLQKIYDSEGKFYLQPPKGGLIISASLAKELQAKRGDTLHMKTPYSGDDEIAAPVLGIVNESLGTTAYMELDAMCALLNVPRCLNSVVINTRDVGHVKSALLDADNVASVTDQASARKVYEDLLQTYGSMFLFMQLAGAAVAFAIITNTASISLSERKREYATLRVLGLHPREIARILGFEYWLLALIGILPGIPLVRMFKQGISGMMDTTMFTIPVSSPLASYITAAALCLATVWLCNLLSARQIAKFDMVEVLKERE